MHYITTNKEIKKIHQSIADMVYAASSIIAEKSIACIDLTLFSNHTVREENINANFIKQTSLIDHKTRAKFKTSTTSTQV